MRLATWNLRSGGGERTSQVLEAVAAHALDAVVLTEFRIGKTGETIRSGLIQQGLVHQATVAFRPKENSVLLASRQPFSPGSVRPLPQGHEHRCVVADLGGVVILGLYFPQKKDKAPLFDWLLDLPAEVRATRTLLLGDFNTGLHHLDEPGSKFYCEDRFQGLLEQGWVDVWRERNPERREFSWFSSTGNGFRIDHALAAPALASAVRTVAYSHDERIRRVSDHSMLLLELE